MRILTVRQPWAWAILHGGKTVENRAQNLAGGYRGPVAIHAAIGATANLTDTDVDLLLTHDVDGKVESWIEGEPIEGGVILGVVDLVDVHWSGMECARGPATCHEYNLCSPWSQAYVQHLVLANPRALSEPIPYTGALGLRHLDADTTARLLAQIGEAA